MDPPPVPPPFPRSVLPCQLPVTQLHPSLCAMPWAGTGAGALRWLRRRLAKASGKSTGWQSTSSTANWAPNEAETVKEWLFVPRGAEWAARWGWTVRRQTDAPEIGIIWLVFFPFPPPSFLFLSLLAFSFFFVLSSFFFLLFARVLLLCFLVLVHPGKNNPAHPPMDWQICQLNNCSFPSLLFRLRSLISLASWPAYLLSCLRAGSACLLSPSLFLSCHRCLLN